MADKTQLEILIQIREELAGLRRTQNELKEAKNQAGLLGGAINKNIASTQNLNRANMLLAGALSGNVAGAANVVRGAFVSMMGPAGLAIAAATTLALKLHSAWKESKAAEAAREADEYAWALNRARENADDLARSSVNAFVSAMTEAKKYYKETGDELQRQYESMQRIAKARLGLEQAKIRANPNLTEEQKILAEQKLLNEHEASIIEKKGELLREQQALAELAKANADRDLEAAEKAFEATKAKPREQWIDPKEIARMERVRSNLKSQVLGASQSANAIRGDGTFEGEQRANQQRQAAEENILRLKRQIAKVEKGLADARNPETVEANYKRDLAAQADMLASAKANAAEMAVNLTTANQRLKEFQTTEVKVAETEKERRDTTANAQTDAARLKTEKEINDETQRAAALKQRIAARKEQTDLGELHLAKQLAAADPSLSRAERQAKINSLVAEETELLKKLIAEREKAAGETQDAGELERLRAEILRLKQQLLAVGDSAASGPQRNIDRMRENASIRKEDPEADPYHLTAGEGIEAGIYSVGESLGSVGENIADLFSGTLLDSIEAVSEGIYGWITGTESFGDVLRNLGDSIFKEMLNTIIRIGAQWLINTILVKTGLISIQTTEDSLRTQRDAKSLASAAKQTAANTPGAAAAGISSWGMALVFGALAIALILAATSAFATGGPVAGGKQLAWLNDGTDGPEYVIKGASRAKYGDALLSQINAGTFDPASALAASGGELRSNGSLTDALASAIPGQTQSQGDSRPIVFFDRDSLADYILASGRFGDRVTEVTDRGSYRTA